MAKVQSKNKEIGITFLGMGSYAYTKVHKQHTGLHWTIQDNKYLLMSVKPSSVKEMVFDNFEDLVKYCAKHYPDTPITT